MNIQFSLVRPSADVGLLQTAVMVDVWQREYSLLSQVMSHSQISKRERKKEEKATNLHENQKEISIRKSI